MWFRNEVLLVLIQYIWIFVSDILFIWQYGFFHDSTASTIQILQDLNILMKYRDTSFLNLMYSFSFVNSFSLSFWMCLLGLFLTHYQKHLGCSSYLQPGYTVYVCLKCRCLKVCGFCFELENFDPVLLCITTPESSWTDFWNHLQKEVCQMINGNAENAEGKLYGYSCCFEQITYLLFAAEQTGTAWWFGLCRRPVPAGCVLSIFFYYCYQFTKGIWQQGRVYIVVEFQYKNLTDWSTEKLFSLHII